ncbi:MAG: ethanolamine ammonia-lyase subunit EutC [Gemmatimonadales bacterium]
MVAEPDPWTRLRGLTPARIGLGQAGGSLTTEAHLSFQLAHARARDAVHERLDAPALIARLAAVGLEAVLLRSAAPDRITYLQRPDLGRRLDPESHDRLARATSRRSTPFDVCFVVADGLSAPAAERHAPAVLAALAPGLAAEDWRLAPVVVVEQGRVGIGDEIGAVCGAAMVAVLLGERPGLSSPDSLGIYVTWAPAVGRRDADRNCISNVRPAGLPPELAADRLHFLLSEARRRKLTGIALKDESRLLRE